LSVNSSDEEVRLVQQQIAKYKSDTYAVLHTRETPEHFEDYEIEWRENAHEDSKDECVRMCRRLQRYIDGMVQLQFGNPNHTTVQYLYDFM
jgi:hypothetical protein